MKTILAVDDSPANLTIVREVLKDRYKVNVVTSGEQALKFLEKKEPDLILLDVCMPGMDGIETMKRINMLLKDIARSPFEGVGRPEPLKYGEPGRWSRRINEADRLVYRIKDDAIIILQCKGHYDD